MRTLPLVQGLSILLVLITVSLADESSEIPPVKAPGLQLMGNRFFTLHTVVQANQIEVTRDTTLGEDGLLWREHFKNSDKLDYRFVQRGCGIRGSESDLEIRG